MVERPGTPLDAVIGRGTLLQQRRRWKEAEALFRKALVKAPGSIELRLKLSETLIQQGKAGALPRVLRPALGPGRAASGLERFRVLMTLMRSDEAFAEGELLCARDRSPETALALSWPWGLVWPDQGGAAAYFRGQLEALGGDVRSPWRTLYRGILKRRALQDDSGYEDLARIAEFSPKRYGWMYFELGRARLYGSDFHGAIRAFQDYASFLETEDWTARAYAGEAYACLGRRAEAVREFKAAVAAAPDKGAALAWFGQILLWFGLYERALAVEEQACALGARYGFCWRAVAKLALGRTAEALPDLARALALKSWDQEALVWLGEAERRLGRPRRALKALDRAAATGNSWALWNRALARADGGDLAGMLADYRAIERVNPAALAYVAEELGVRAGTAPSARQALAVLKAGLRLNPVIRDPLQYKNAAWMRRGAA